MWYKDAVFYELRVASFFDSDDDGIGDLRGLAAKLDYLQELGVTTLWLLPFFPSPLRDDGYDIADYTSVHPRYGSLADFRKLVREAHRRELRIVIELVLNHTSDQHPWFQRARRAPRGSRWRNFYVWSDDPTRYAEARIIFKDFETSNWAWDPVAGQYYWHRFYSHQPDLNYDNPEVRRAMLRVVDFWFGMGVDGMRLDAVPYLFEREGTSCENLPETHAFLRELRAHVDARFPDRMLLAEANQWPEDAVAYFGKGDECHMAFHFPIMPRLFMALRMEDRYPILDILAQTPPIPPSCQWATFLRNHDELTLEMVTDEERDYMWRVYARDPKARINLGIRRRLAPLLDNDRRRIELMNALLLSLPGTPVLYYGDEIGMGDNIFLGDRDGVRTPMQWSPDRNAGFSKANPQSLVLPVITDPEYHYEAVNVEVQERNPSSLLWWMRRILALRRRWPVFGRGSFEPVGCDNRRVLAFRRRYEEQDVLVVANLSRFAQSASLELDDAAGCEPEELFGGSRFPRVERGGWRVAVGPHGFYWLALRRAPERIELPGAGAALPTFRARGGPAELFGPALGNRLAEALRPWIRTRRWYRSKARVDRSAALRAAVALDEGPLAPWLAFVEFEYAEGEPEVYVLPLVLAPEARGGEAPALARVETPRGALAVCDGSEDPEVARALLRLLARRRAVEGRGASVSGVPLAPASRLRSEGEPVTPLRAEQTNSGWCVDARLLVKLLRLVEPGENVEAEVLRHLGARRFAHAPRLLGHADVEVEGLPERATLALAIEFVANEGDAWRFTLDQIARYLDEALALGERRPPEGPHHPVEASEADPEPERLAPLGPYYELARLLGQRTAELHAALLDPDAPAFAPERLTPFVRRGLFQSFRNLAARTLDALAARRDALPDEVRARAERILAERGRIESRAARILDPALDAPLVRIHGDLHLGQVLWTGRDFVFIDFEGEPARSLGERRRKRVSLVDVAGMLRSFDYAMRSCVAERALLEGHGPEERDRIEAWCAHWVRWTCGAYLRGYRGTDAAHRLLPRDREALRELLDLALLEKCLYEIGYELQNRPDWVDLPLRGLEALLGLGR